MKITFKRLREIFKLADNRQLYVQLESKMTVLDGKNVEITDPKLIVLFTELENDQVLTINEAAELYGEKPDRLTRLASSGHVEYFRLAQDKKGSSILFQKSKLESFLADKLRYMIKERDLEKKRELEFRILTHLPGIGPRDREMLIDFYVKLLSYDEIGEKYDITRERVRQQLQKAGTRLSVLVNTVFDEKYGFNYYQQRCADLETELAVHKADLLILRKEEEEKLLAPIEILGKLLVDCDFTVRLLNNLSAIECKNINDVLKWRKQDLLKCRNFGKKSIVELQEFLQHHGLSLKS